MQKNFLTILALTTILFFLFADPAFALQATDGGGYSAADWPFLKPILGIFDLFRGPLSYGIAGIMIMIGFLSISFIGGAGVVNKAALGAISLGGCAGVITLLKTLGFTSTLVLP